MHIACIAFRNSFRCSVKRAEDFQKQFFHNFIDPFLQSNRNDVCRCWQCWWREFLYYRRLRASVIYETKLYRKSLKHPTAFNQSEYSKYRNYLTKLLRCQERNYYANLINQNKHNLSKTWSVISTVINNKKSIAKCSNFLHINRYITNGNEIANHLNKYFVNIGPNLDTKSRIYQTVHLHFTNFSITLAIIVSFSM